MKQTGHPATPALVARFTSREGFRQFAIEEVETSYSVNVKGTRRVNELVISGGTGVGG